MPPALRSTAITFPRSPPERREPCGAAAIPRSRPCVNAGRITRHHATYSGSRLISPLSMSPMICLRVKFSTWVLTSGR